MLRPKIILALAVAAALTPAVATTAEDTYIAARDAAIAKIKAAADAEPKNPASGGDHKVDALDDQERAGLEKQMRVIIGPVAIAGLDGESAINLDTLNDGDEGFGMLDGMAYGGPDAKTRVIVTTDSLFRRWLQQHKNWADIELPQDPSVAIKDQDFYSQAVLTDAAIVHYADLPIASPPGAAFVYAMLAARTQSDLPSKADEIFVAVSQDGRVFIANTKELKPVGPIPACDAIRDDLAKKAEAAANSGDAKAQEKADALSAQSETDFSTCFAAKAPQQSGFAEAVKAAQALLGRLPSH